MMPKNFTNDSENLKSIGSFRSDELFQIEHLLSHRFLIYKKNKCIIRTEMIV